MDLAEKYPYMTPAERERAAAQEAAWAAQEQRMGETLIALRQQAGAAQSAPDVAAVLVGLIDLLSAELDPDRGEQPEAERAEKGGR